MKLLLLKFTVVQGARGQFTKKLRMKCSCGVLEVVVIVWLFQFGTEFSARTP